MSPKQEGALLNLLLSFAHLVLGRVFMRLISLQRESRDPTCRVEALEGEFEEPAEEYIWLKQRARARNCTHLYMNP